MPNPHTNMVGNIMTRLAGIKSASSKRRVVPGAEYEDELETENPDISGTALEIPNMPEADLGGELTPQSYDIRANNSPDEQNPRGKFGDNVGESLRSLGANLWNIVKNDWTPGLDPSVAQRYGMKSVAQTPPIETSEVHESEGLPPVTASQEFAKTSKPQPSPGVLGAIADYFNPTKRDQMAEFNRQQSQDAQLLSQGLNPEEERAKKQQNLNNDIDKAMQNPWQFAAYGSAEEIANSPVLQAEFKKYTGVDYDDEIKDQVSKHEEAMKGIEDAYAGLNTQLSEQAESIRQRILNNQTTDMDKYYIGLALLLPLIVGGFFGKEAALGALAGGAEGFTKILGNRDKSMREDEASLLDLNKQQTGIQEKLANVALEKAKIEPFIRKNMPEDQTKHLIGMQKIEFIDPENGKPTEAYEVLPGFVAKERFVNTEKGRERMEKAASELSETKTYVDQVNDLTNNVMDVLSQLKDKPWWKKAHIPSINAMLPGSLSTLSDKVQWKGQMVPAGPLLENQFGILANQYAHAQDLGQLDRAAQAHMEKLFGNPTKTLLTPKDVESQIMNIRQFVQQELINKTKNKGFYPEFVIQHLEKQNSPLHKGLNQREDQKYNQELKKKAFQSEI